jgi:hypothetical protein
MFFNKNRVKFYGGEKNVKAARQGGKELRQKKEAAV